MFIFSQFWKLEVQGQGAIRVGFWCSLFPWLADSHLLSVSPPGFPVSPPLLIRTPVLVDQNATLMASFNFKNLLKAPSLEGVKASAYETEEDTIRSSWQMESVAPPTAQVLCGCNSAGGVTRPWVFQWFIVICALFVSALFSFLPHSPTRCSRHSL